MVYKCFDEKTLATRNKSAIKNENISNKELHSSFIDNIWGADLDDMQLTSKFDKGFKFIANMDLLFLWKTKKALQLLMAFKKF